MKRSSSTGRSIVSASTMRRRAECSTFPLVVVAVVIAVVERVDLVLEVLVDLLALDLERRCELALFLGQLAREDLELLDLLDVREVLVRGVDRLLDRGLVRAVVVVLALAVGGDERDQVRPVVAVDDRLRDRRAARDLLLDVRRRDVLARRRDDDLLGPTGDREEPLVVDR